MTCEVDPDIATSFVLLILSRCSQPRLRRAARHRWSSLLDSVSIAAAALTSGLVLAAGRSSRVAGVVLVAAYVGISGSFFVASDR
jgi:hypothetical protein